MSLRCVSCGADLAPRSDAPIDSSLLGRRVADYDVIGEISKNRRASLYRARHTSLGRMVALKVLGAEVASDERARARFLREARALARVDHPNVVRVFEVGEVDELPFFAMSLHDGPTLRARIEEGLSLEHATGIARALASALAAIHAEGVVHRDLKPENVVFPAEGGIKLVDFGLSRLTDRGPESGDRTITVPGAVLGTLPYLAPEQLLGERVDGRADLFALGVVFFEMLARKTPFAGHEGTLVRAILDRGPMRLAEVRPDVPGSIQAIVDGLLERTQAARIPSAVVLEQRLIAALPSQLAPDVPVSSRPPREGDVVGERYQLEREIGRGAAGTVWRARHLVLASPCAVKILREDAISVPKSRARFFDEARVLAQLDDDAIVRVLDAGTHAGRPYLAMEMLDGETLASAVDREGALSKGRALGVLRSIGGGLDAAHRAGIVHRDLKPSNVFLTAEPQATAKLLDFGISKTVGATAGSTEGFGLSVAPDFMSPEQIAGAEPIDHRTDLFSLGAVAFYALTGVKPFAAENFTAVCDAITNGPTPSATAVDASLPGAIDAWLTRALAKSPDARFASGAEMMEALATALEPRAAVDGAAPPSEIEPATVPYRPSRTTIPAGQPHPRRAVAIAGWIVLVVLVGVVGVLVGRWIGSRE